MTDPAVLLHLGGLDKHPAIPPGTPLIRKRGDRWYVEAIWHGNDIWLDVAHSRDDAYPVVGALCYHQASKNGQPELAQAWDDWMTACEKALEI